MKRFLCWLGFCKIERTKAYLTSCDAHCINCGRQYIDSIFGLFEKD